MTCSPEHYIGDMDAFSPTRAKAKGADMRFDERSHSKECYGMVDGPKHFLLP